MEIDHDANVLNVDFNGNVSDDSARTIFERHDADGNDALDMTEFTEFLKSMFQALQPHHTAALRHRALSPTDLAQATAGQAFAIAESAIGIPKMLDAVDMVAARPDEKSVMTYISFFWKEFASTKKRKPHASVERQAARRGVPSSSGGEHSPRRTLSLAHYTTPTRA